MKTNYELKKDFPIFDNSDLVYLDNAATSQKPKQVINDLHSFYSCSNANPHRGAYKLSVMATEAYSNARHEVAKFLNARYDDEIIFTKNATEALNLIAYSYGLDNLQPGDEVVISIMEHHSNLVPWQKVTAARGATLKYLYINSDFEIPSTELDKITTKTKIVSVVSVSNVLGTINNVNKIAHRAHEVGAICISDITQSVAHTPFDVQNNDVDFAVFSGHKMYGPLGVGVLYGRREILNKMTPFLTGGDMIEYVYEQHTTFSPIPNKFEAGTQNVAGAVGLASAIKYLNNIGFENIAKIENELLDYTLSQLKKLPFVQVYGTSNRLNHASVVAFNIKNIHPHDVASILDAQNVCIRSGNHCAQPLHRFMGVDSTCRVSLAFYNTKEDVDKFIAALNVVYNKFKKYFK